MLKLSKEKVLINESEIKNADLLFFTLKDLAEKGEYKLIKIE